MITYNCFACGAPIESKYSDLDKDEQYCEKCEEIFEDIKDTVCDTKQFRYGREIRPVSPHEGRGIDGWTFCMLDAGDKKLKDIFAERFPLYADTPNNYELFAKRAGLSFD